MHIWKRLKKPIWILAPMAGVTDSALRQVILKNGRPDLFFTEFVSCAGLCSEGRENLLPDLSFVPEEKPIIAQVFGCNPDQFYETAQLIAELGYDGIDINTGCPDRSVQRQGAGAMLIQDPELTKKIVLATKRGAGDLPVSVKTRIGYSEENLTEWLKHLLEVEPAAVSIHWRTKKEMYKGSAHWELAAGAVKTVQESGTDTLLIGNGDVTSLDQAKQLVAETGVDGVMIGRAIFSNPWIFNPDIDPEQVGWRERVQTMLDHLDFFEKTFGDDKHLLLIRKHVKSYINNFRGAKDLRVELTKVHTADEMRMIIREFTGKGDA